MRVYNISDHFQIHFENIWLFAIRSLKRKYAVVQSVMALGLRGRGYLGKFCEVSMTQWQFILILAVFSMMLSVQTTV